MIKGPALVVLDFKTGMARRYLRRKNQVVAGIGWELGWTHEAKFDPSVELPAAAVETFRVTGT